MICTQVWYVMMKSNICTLKLNLNKYNNCNMWILYEYTYIDIEIITTNYYETLNNWIKTRNRRKYNSHREL